MVQLLQQQHPLKQALKASEKGSYLNIVIKAYPSYLFPDIGDPSFGSGTDATDSSTIVALVEPSTDNEACVATYVVSYDSDDLSTTSGSGSGTAADASVTLSRKK